MPTRFFMSALSACVLLGTLSGTALANPCQPCVSLQFASGLCVARHGADDPVCGSITHAAVSCWSACEAACDAAEAVVEACAARDDVEPFICENVGAILDHCEEARLWQASADDEEVAVPLLPAAVRDWLIERARAADDGAAEAPPEEPAAEASPEDPDAQAIKFARTLRTPAETERQISDSMVQHQAMAMHGCDQGAQTAGRGAGLGALLLLAGLGRARRRSA